MRQIPLGAKGTATLRVQPEHLANRFKDAMLPQVLATPVMILIMENAALNAIKPFLDAGESAVGVAVDVKHLAATPVGHRNDRYDRDQRDSRHRMPHPAMGNVPDLRDQHADTQARDHSSNEARFGQRAGRKPAPYSVHALPSAGRHRF